MVQLGSGGFSQIDREELDDEQIIICPSHSTCEAVILQPNDGVNFTIISDDVAWRPKMSQKMSVAHGAPECVGTKCFRAKVASVTIIVAPSTWVPHAWLELCIIIPWAMSLVRRRFRPDPRPSRVAAGQETFW
jgi:hypothetical protein